MSSSLGMPGNFEDKKMISAIQKVENICKIHNKSIGYHIIEPNANLVNEKIKSGYNFIAFSTDFLFLGVKSSQEFKKISY